MNNDQCLQEQERDMNRARTELETFFLKCETGMQTLRDCQEAKSNLLLFGIKIED